MLLNNIFIKSMGPTLSGTKMAMRNLSSGVFGFTAV